MPAIGYKEGKPGKAFLFFEMVGTVGIEPTTPRV